MDSRPDATQAFADISASDEETPEVNGGAEDVTPPTTETKETPKGEEKRLSDTLKAAQREFHELARMKKEYQDLLSGAKMKPKEVEPLKVEFGKDFSDALLESPENATRMLAEKFNTVLSEMENRNRDLLYRIEELRNSAGVEDPAERAALKQVNELPYATYLSPEEKVDLAKRFAALGKSSETPGREPPAMGSQHRPPRERKPEKPKIDERIFQASGASRDPANRAKVW